MESICPICKFPLRPRTNELNILTFLKQCTFDFSTFDNDNEVSKQPTITLTENLPFDIATHIGNQCDMKTRTKMKYLCRDYKNKLNLNIPTIHNGLFAWTHELCIELEDPERLIDVRMDDWEEFSIDKKKYSADINEIKEIFCIGDDDEEDENPDDDPDWLHIETSDVVHKCCIKQYDTQPYKKWKDTLAEYVSEYQDEYFDYFGMILKIIGIKTDDEETILDENGKEINIGEDASIPTFEFLKQSHTPETLANEIKKIKEFYGFDTNDPTCWLKQLKALKIATLQAQHPELGGYEAVNDYIYSDVVFLSDLPIYDYFKNFKITNERCKLLQYLLKGPPKSEKGGAVSKKKINKK